MWKSTVLHEPRNVPKVFQGISYRHKFKQNVPIMRRCAEEVLNESFGEHGGPKYFGGALGDSGMMVAQNRDFPFPKCASSA